MYKYVEGKGICTNSAFKPSSCRGIIVFTPYQITGQCRSNCIANRVVSRDEYTNSCPHISLSNNTKRGLHDAGECPRERFDIECLSSFHWVMVRGAGTMFKLGGGQDPSAGFGSSWVEGYIPGEYPGAQLVLNKEVLNKLLLFSTGHEPTRSHP